MTALNPNCEILTCPCKNDTISRTCWTSAEQGDYNGMVRRIEANKSLINKFDPYGYSPLHYAAQHNHLKIVNYLLINGANVNANSCGATPLHRAAYNGRYESCCLLIENGADINIQDSSFGDLNTPLQKSLYQLILKIEEDESSEIIQNFKEVIKLLLSKGSNISIKNSKNYTARDFLEFYGLSEENILLFSKSDLQQSLQQRGGKHFEGVVINNNNNNKIKEQPVYCQFIDKKSNNTYFHNNFNDYKSNNDDNNNSNYNKCNNSDNNNRGTGSKCSICFLEKLSFVKSTNDNLICTNCSKKYIIGMIK